MSTVVSPPGQQHLSKNRFEALDGLRGVAAVVVICFHARRPNHLTQNEFLGHGYLAVDLFFILSGFVISSSYSTTLTDFGRIRKFVCLRFFRVYPLHLAVLAAFVVIELVKLWSLRSGMLMPDHMPFANNNSVNSLVANIFLVHSLDVLGSLSWNSPSWSISCEFVAYILFAIGVLAIPFRNVVSFSAIPSFWIG
jgi:peptidoglycan/LPS O-acetylase OafA/YrhL